MVPTQTLRSLLHALRAEEMAEAEEEAEEEAAAAGQRPIEALDVGDGGEMRGNWTKVYSVAEHVRGCVNSAICTVFPWRLHIHCLGSQLAV